MFTTLFEILTALSIIDLMKATVQVLSGKLLTEEQIRDISKDTVGAYFAEWLPTPQNEIERQKRVEQAQIHITEASRIISGLRGDLDDQVHQLDEIIREVEEKKRAADHYATLARTSQEAFAAFKAEMEEALRRELRTEAEKGRLARRVVSIIVWLITLALGAALGAYFLPLIDFVRSLLKI